MSSSTANIAPSPPLSNVLPGVRGHFILNVYAAVFHLLFYLQRAEQSLEDLQTRYPFLGRYWDAMRWHMPDITWEEGCQWWEVSLSEWEDDCEFVLPLRNLAQLGIDFPTRMAFVLAGLVEEDSRFGSVFADLQSPLRCRRPTAEMLGQIAAASDTLGDREPWNFARTLYEQGYLATSDPQLPRSEWPLFVPAALWDVVRGDVSTGRHRWFRYTPPNACPTVDELILSEPIRARLANLPNSVEVRKPSAILLRARPGVDTSEIFGAMAWAMGRGLVEVGLESIGTTGPAEEAIRTLGPLATLTHSLPVVRYELGPGETASPPALCGYRGWVGVALGMEGGLAGELGRSAATITIPRSTSELRAQHWRRALGGRAVAELDRIVANYHLDGGYIRDVAHLASVYAAMEARDEFGAEHVQAAAREINRQNLDSLADRLEPCGSWDQFVGKETTVEKLSELALRCRYREHLLEHLGRAFSGNANPGVRALFTGSSGTGKTLAAKMLAAELGMDIYRIDLASIVNKYIGETEKNLHRVLSYAEALDVILLIDEGDTLLGQRTEVKSANDRYANLETNYLLQRLENYEGIVLVTTNLSDNIDPAFQRRMDIVVPFFLPDSRERWHIMQLHLPASHALEDSFLQSIVQRCALTGGQIRNACLHATLLALNERALVGPSHLLEAFRSEYQKAGATCPLGRVYNTRIAEADGGMGGFQAAMNRHAS